MDKTEEDVLSDASVDDRLVDNKISWSTAAWVINASVIGMGVLTLPACFVTLGWICGFLSLFVCLGANLMVAQVMLEVRDVYPRAISFPDAAHHVFGSRTVKELIRYALYTEKVACTAVYIQLMARTLGTAFHTVHWCLGAWCCIIFAIFLPLMKLKNFSDTHALNLINFCSIVLVIALTSYSIVQKLTVIAFDGLLSPDDAVQTFLWPQASSFSEASGALACVIFAFSGNWMYFELIAEMERPTEFMKSFTIAGPTQMLLYSATACVGYAYMGSFVPDQITDAMPFSTLMRLVSFLLAVHLVAGTGTNIVVVIRFFHSRISPKDVNSTGWRAQLIRTMLYVGILGGCIFVTLAVPSFLSLVTFVGAFFEAPICFILPMVLYYGMVRKNPSRVVLAKNNFFVACLVIIALVGLMITVLGVQYSFETFSWAETGAFACNCIGMWSTCYCSANKMPDGWCLIKHDDPHSHNWFVPSIVH